MRDYCDKYIGLDCNGFAGNYARATGRANGPSTPIPFYRLLPLGPPPRRDDADRLQPLPFLAAAQALGRRELEIRPLVLAAMPAFRRRQLLRLFEIPFELLVDVLDDLAMQRLVVPFQRQDVVLLAVYDLLRDLLLRPHLVYRDYPSPYVYLPQQLLYLRDLVIFLREYLLASFHPVLTFPISHHVQLALTVPIVFSAAIHLTGFAPKSDLRTRIEDVQADDVMAWTHYSHITVILSIQPATTGSDGKPACDRGVVESSAHNPSKAALTQHGGFQHSTYSIRSVGVDKVFAIERPKRGRPGPRF